MTIDRRAFLGAAALAAAGCAVRKCRGGAPVCLKKLGTYDFRDMSDMKTFTPPFARGLHMGNAFVAGDRVVVTAVEKWGGSRILQLESADLVHWTKPRAILGDPSWAAYNTTMCRADDRYVLGFELGKPSELVGTPFTMFFAESTDLVSWKVVRGACMGADRSERAFCESFFPLTCGRLIVGWQRECCV